jgi:putative flippase GtrA
MWLLTDVASVHYLLSKIVSASAVFFFNFFSRKALLFRPRRGRT